MRKKVYIIITVMCSLVLFSCKPNKATTTGTEEEIVVQTVGPTFCADSAMAYCNAQCEFGPRTMNSTSHDNCEKWIAEKFTQFGLTVNLQKADLKGWDGTMLHSTNIIARYNPEAERRILLCAHWDSRPWADNDPDPANHHTPVMAANDGASGVGVMLEVARLLQADTTQLAIGIDFVCFDAEDYGTPDWAENQEGSADTWALGSQYFATHLNEGKGYAYGILLDMVGGQGASFYQEGFSMQYAAHIVEKIWTSAREAGYGSFFVNDKGGDITDDHDPLNKAGIPTVDIIPYYRDCEQSSFGPTWHTVNDDMNHLDKKTLEAVGQTLIQVLYKE